MSHNAASLLEVCRLNGIKAKARVKADQVKEVKAVKADH
jgi:hypothetical protein